MSRWFAMSALLLCCGCEREAASIDVDLPLRSAAINPEAAENPSWLEGGSAAQAPSPSPEGGLIEGQTEEVRQERVAQQSLPKSDHPLWTVLKTTRISENMQTGFFSASHPPAVQALSGKTVTLTGFMVPLDQEEETRHFLLSRYTPTCFFCPPGDPNDVVEIRTRKPRQSGFAFTQVRGIFSLADNGEKGLFFRLEEQ